MISVPLRAIGDHLWQSTLFAIVAGLLALALRKNRARVRHTVWLAASLKFLVPVSFLIAAGSHISWRTAPAAAQSGFTEVVETVSLPFTGRFTVPAGLEVSTPAAPPATNTITLLALGIWACGFAGIMASWLIRWRRIGAVVRAGTPVKLAVPIRAIASPSRLEPGVFGIFRPVLLLPEEIFLRLSPAQLRAVIAHEFAHVRHRDNLVAAIHMFVETTFWFHPLVWWIGKRMVAERERACDEEVLRLGNEPRVYAEGILSICSLYVESPRVCVAGVTGPDLKRRIQAILARRVGADLSFARKAGLAAAAIVCLAIPILIGVLRSPRPRGETELSVPSFPASAVRFRDVSIRPCTTYTEPAGVASPSPGRLILHCQTVIGLINIAYGKSTTGPSVGPWYTMHHPLPVSGGPVWMGSASYRYQIDA